MPRAPPRGTRRGFSEMLLRARHPEAARAGQRAMVAGDAAAARADGHLATARELRRARAGHGAEACRVCQARAEGLPAKARRDIADALERELAAPQRPQPAAPAPGQPEREAPAPRVESVPRLLERIEVFLRAGKPRLELTVGGPFDAVVLLERTGRREVAVTIRGRNGPPPPGELSRVREHLERRGLKLSSLAIARG